MIESCCQGRLDKRAVATMLAIAAGPCALITLFRVERCGFEYPPNGVPTVAISDGLNAAAIL